MTSTIVKFGLLPIKRTVFLMCDMQEKMRPHISYFKEIVQSSKKLLETSKMMEVPLIVTEHYSKGLGKTIPELDVGHAKGIFEKTRFSMMIPEVSKELNSLCERNVECVVLFGIEAHVCVEQTAADLCAHGFQVHIVADATSSRTQEDRLLAFERLRQIGCFLATSENVMFKLLGGKDSPHFKQATALARAPTIETGLAQ